MSTEPEYCSTCEQHIDECGCDGFDPAELAPDEVGPGGYSALDRALDQEWPRSEWEQRVAGGTCGHCGVAPVDESISSQMCLDCAKSVASIEPAWIP